MEQTKIIFDNKNFEYNKLTNSIVRKDNFLVIILIIFIIFFLSVSYSLLLNFEWKPLKTLEKFKRIKKNMNSWASIINEKIGIEVNKGRYLALSKPAVTQFKCIDYGNYYVPGRISPATYLPEFVRRGNSGPWFINKTTINTDVPSLQFCNYLLYKYVTNSSNLDNLITCGTDMLDKIGYSGFFIFNSPCEKAISVLI